MSSTYRSHETTNTAMQLVEPIIVAEVGAYGKFAMSNLNRKNALKQMLS